MTIHESALVLKSLREHRELMYLTVVLAHLPLMEVDASSNGLEVSRDAVGIDAMRLGESMGDARVLR